MRRFKIAGISKEGKLRVHPRVELPTEDEAGIGSPGADDDTQRATSVYGTMLISPQIGSFALRSRGAVDIGVSILPQVRNDRF
jgi:hypothetical protein